MALGCPQFSPKAAGRKTTSSHLPPPHTTNHHPRLPPPTHPYTPRGMVILHSFHTLSFIQYQGGYIRSDNCKINIITRGGADISGALSRPCFVRARRTTHLAFSLSSPSTRTSTLAYTLSSLDSNHTQNTLCETSFDHDHDFLSGFSIS